MLDNTQHRMKELVCLNFRPGITWKERKQVIGKYIPANIDPWFYKLADIYLPFTQPKKETPPVIKKKGSGGRGKKPKTILIRIRTPVLPPLTL